MDRIYIALIFCIAAPLLFGLFSRHSNWPRREVLVALWMSVGAGAVFWLLDTEYVQQSVGAKGFWFLLAPLLMMAAMPTAVVAAALWLYIAGRAIRFLWVKEPPTE